MRAPHWPRSLERKLPLLMTAVLVVILAASLFLTLGALTLSAKTTAYERLSRAVHQVASSVNDGLRERGARVRAVADAPALRSATAAMSDLATVRTALARLAGARDSLPIELWREDGRRAVVLSDAPWRAPFTRAELAARARDTDVSFSPMFGDGSNVYFWVVAPIRANGAVTGFVAQQRRVTGAPGGTTYLRELTGELVTMYMFNDDRRFWASAPGVPVSGPTRVDSSGPIVTAERPSVGRVVFAEGDIQGAPYGVSLETPLRAVVGRARSTVATLAAVSVLLVLVGAGISWIISRRVTAPLVTLTTAAEAIARGDYGRPTPASERQDEIGRLAASFDQMAHDVAASRRELERRILDAEVARKEAERASRAKSDFLAVMSHELRTPLNAIAGYTQLLELGVYGDLTDAQRNALTRIARSQTHLLTLINDVLNFAKIDAGQMHYDIAAVSLHYVLDGLEAFIAPQLQAKQLTFTQTPCSPALTVRGDAEKLRQIVLNLLTNAIKFTPAGGVVALECEATGTVAHVRVRDSGVGIPADRIEAIFEPFVQGERALNKPNEGVGLGLAIARDLARGMGGSLAAESAVGEGSVFTLTLPLVTPTAALPREHQNSADQERVKAGTE